MSATDHADDLTDHSPESAPVHSVGVTAESVSIRSVPALQRVFQIVICDWAGIAGAHHHEDASMLARLAEPLLADGIWLAIVTDTGFESIDRQFCDLLMPDLRRRVVVCANRGSEVFGFDERGHA